MVGKGHAQALAAFEDVTISANETYSTALDFRAYSLLAVDLAVTGGSLVGSRLCVQGATSPDDTYKTIDEEFAAYTVTDKTAKILPLVDSTNIGAIVPRYLRFYFDNGSGTPQAQTATVTITCHLKNVG